MTVSATARAAAYAQETGEVFLILLTIDHPDFAQPIRVVNNTVAVTSNGEEYVAFPFDLVLPSEDEDKEVLARLAIDNVSREIAQALRLISDPPTVAVAVIRAADPDAVEVALPTFTLRNVTWDALAVQGELTLGDVTADSYPQFDFTPAAFPGLF